MRSTLVRLQAAGYDVRAAQLDVTWAAWFDPDDDDASGSGGGSGTLLSRITAWVAALHVHHDPLIRDASGINMLQAALYMSGFRAEMQAALECDMNAAYAAFLVTHPNWRGHAAAIAHLARAAGPPVPPAVSSVSLFSHSLGGVIALDCILARPFPLLFTPRHCFTLGSPTGLYYSLRAMPKPDAERLLLTLAAGPPAGELDSGGVVTRLHNVYDAHDPFAYKLAPLLWPSATHGPPPAPHVVPAYTTATALRSFTDTLHKATGSEAAHEPATKVEKRRLSIGPSTVSRSVAPACATAVTSTSSTHPPLLPVDVQLPQGGDPTAMQTSRFADNSATASSIMALVNDFIMSYDAHKSYWTSSDCIVYVLTAILS